MSDGGDGFGAVSSSLLKARPRRARTVDAAHRPCSVTWWWNSKSKTAIIESANVIGLARLPHGKFHPFDRDSFGLGKLMLAVRKQGAKKIILGLGGSATNDGGFGMARALGWKFLDRNERELTRWIELERLARIAPPEHRFGVPILSATDVSNHLLGKRGATRIFGPQKGLCASDLEKGEACLRQLASKVARATGVNHAIRAGAGAAGGLGFGLMAFAGASARKGFDLFARWSRLRTRVAKSDLVITGEGRLDASSLMGKGVGEVSAVCKGQGVPCFLICGSLEGSAGLGKGHFCRISALAAMASRSKARHAAGHWLEELAYHEAKQWNSARSNGWFNARK